MSKTTIQGSPEQEAIWEAMRHSQKNLLIRALAGTGKTFSMIHGLQLMGPKPPWLGRLCNTVMLAFNVNIRDELKTKVPPWTQAKTTHQFGLRILHENFDGLVIDQDKSFNHAREYGAAEFGWRKLRAWPRGLMSCVNRVVGFAKNEGIPVPDSPTPSLDTLEFLEELVKLHGIIFPDGEKERGYQIIHEVLRWSASDETNLIDFDDMLWLPYVYDLRSSVRYDLLIVDEAQDLNRMQHDLCLRNADRIIVVGDPFQSIYGFRGADTRSMARLEDALAVTSRGVEVLPLTVCRRCSHSVIDLAQTIVPEIQAMETAPLGDVIIGTDFSVPVPRDDYDDACPDQELPEILHGGDMVLCRTNAPLVSLFYHLVSRHVPAYIRGRKIGEELIELVTSLRERPDLTNDLLVLEDRLNEYESFQIKRMREQDTPESKIALIIDKVACLKMIASAPSVQNVEALKQELSRIFTDFRDEDKVCLSSVHRAKGLEADQVFIVKPDQMPHPMAKLPWEAEQERNIAYVAITRARRSLFLLGSGIPATHQVPSEF